MQKTDHFCLSKWWQAIKSSVVRETCSTLGCDWVFYRCRSNWYVWSVVTLVTDAKQHSHTHTHTHTHHTHTPTHTHTELLSGWSSAGCGEHTSHEEVVCTCLCDCACCVWDTLWNSLMRFTDSTCALISEVRCKLLKCH